MNGLLNKNGTLKAKAFRMGYIEHYRLPGDNGEEYSISISMENTVVGGYLVFAVIHGNGSRLWFTADNLRHARKLYNTGIKLLAEVREGNMTKEEFRDVLDKTEHR